MKQSKRNVTLSIKVNRNNIIILDIIPENCDHEIESTVTGNNSIANMWIETMRQKYNITKITHEVLK